MHFTPLLQAIKQSVRPSRIYNLKGSAVALFFALMDDPFFVVEHTDEQAHDVTKDINFFRTALNKPQVVYLPEPDGPSRSGERYRIIQTLKDEGSLVSSVQNLNSHIWSHEEIGKSDIHLIKTVPFKRDDLEQKLQASGYKQVPLVTSKGEYRRREWLFDIYPSNSHLPVRIEFFGDEIENIKLFELDTQRSIEDIDQISVFPSAESVSDSSVSRFLTGRMCFLSDSLKERDDLTLDGTYFSRYPIEGTGIDAGCLPLKGLGIFPEERKDIGELAEKIARLANHNRINIICSSSGQAERVKHILMDGGAIAPIISVQEMFDYKGSLSITVGDLSEGLFLSGMIFLTEKELFGGSPGYRSLKKSRVSKLLTSLDDLAPGDFIVHREHGIGIFQGLTRQEVEHSEEDLMILDYEGGRLYIPLQNIHTIHKYHAEEGIRPKIDKLGGKTWQKTKARVTKKIQDMAKKLIRLYAHRQINKGFVFSPDTELHREFDSFFPYEETPDQIRAVEDIKRDMEAERPMDRLICGDVGYGKTEVAMKAAFKAVYDGMQVAVLVPTTILCEQHYRTFKARFSAFPISIDYLSRFKNRREQGKTISALEEGNIDIVIGTHGLLSKDIHFYKLGLLIVDEEHRFGVRQKERIKEFKKGLDVITMTATPIPRTLSMALSHIRNMSIIETPPEERLAVKTTVSIFDKRLIKEALKKELERGGQIFFVHNRIRDIHKIADYLMECTPDMKIGIAHGQMAEKDLARVMVDFYDCRINLLLSTAIIGSGLDIPTANTIIINRADAMGLADLYQLRGRVGRGKVRGFAYLLIPGENIITDEAKKRLQAIQEMSYLGAGFRLALKDLEIRGSGNLLGSEQSGHIHAVGFDLYIEMLEKTVAELKGIPVEEEFEPTIRLTVHAYIPEEYVDNVTLRLSLYRKIASAKTLIDIRKASSEMHDRFGALPQEVENLLDIMKLKIKARELRIAEILESHGAVRLHFASDTRLSPEDIFSLYHSKNKTIRFLPDGFELGLEGMSYQGTYSIIDEILTKLQKSPSLLA